MFQTRTVVFHLPDHLVLLCLLGDFHLHQVSELWLEKRREHRHVCDCSMHARRFVDHPLAKTIPRLGTHWLSRHW